MIEFIKSKRYKLLLGKIDKKVKRGKYIKYGLHTFNSITLRIASHSELKVKNN